MAEAEIVCHGEVQCVGYRQYVVKAARKLGLVGCVKNLEDGTVRILCKGKEENINEFKKQIEIKKPKQAPLIEVEKIISTPIEQGTIKQTTFKVVHGDLNTEIFEGNITDINYLNLFREDTNANFDKMDEKYHVMSQNIHAVIIEIQRTNEGFERRIEKVEKYIESLLLILTEKLK
jgi:acylphosphatase